MNAIGIALLWCVVQVTLLGMLAGGLYWLLRRRWADAAGAVILCGLAMIVFLSCLAFSPWPRWPLPALAQFSATERAPAEQAVAQEPTGDLENAQRESGQPRETQTALPEEPRQTNHTGQALVRNLAAVFRNDARWPTALAAGLLVAACCGLGWLVLGMIAVRWQQRRGRPVADREMLETVDILRAELGCLRPVALREADDLITAATIGWRRPTVLLPADWRDWTPAQRRAILAHEIAHARGHDFLALLIAQLGLTLHFYHPLLHWLVGRLRLEQELAADAAAAQVAGGRRQYLVTIAELALRQQERPLSWPVRTFLPTQTTFLRRIAMLRDSKLRFGDFSPMFRWAAMGTVLLCGVLVAGLRGTGHVAQALAADDKPSAVTEAAPQATAKAENILANASAEQGDDYAEDWLQGAAVPGVQYLWDKNAAHDGKASLCIKKTVNNYSPIAQWSQTVKRTGDLSGLRVSARVKAQKMYKAVLDVSFLDEDGKPISHRWAAYIGAKEQGDPPATHDWKEYAGVVKIPADTAKICVALQDYGPGTVWFDDIQASYVSAPAVLPEVVSHPASKTIELKYDDGKADGKRSFGGSGEMIEFTLPTADGTLKGIRLHGSRYGMPQPPAEDFTIAVLNADRSKTLFTETAPYKLFQRGKEKWVAVKFAEPHKVPKQFWIMVNFNAHQTKGVYVSYDDSKQGGHSMVGLPGQEMRDFAEGDWMIRAVLAAPESLAESQTQ